MLLTADSVRCPRSRKQNTTNCHLPGEKTGAALVRRACPSRNRVKAMEYSSHVARCDGQLSVLGVTALASARTKNEHAWHENVCAIYISIACKSAPAIEAHLSHPNTNDYAGSKSLRFTNQKIRPNKR